MTFKFNREEDSKWYIDYPQWEGDKAELEMVLGADYLLDILSQGEDTVYVNFSLEEVEDYKFELERDREDGGGYYYKVTSSFTFFDVWLCHVTKFVLGDFPQKIWIY